MDLNRYKPRDGSVVAHEAALTVARQDLAAHADVLAEARDRRDALLLGDEPKALRDAEAALRAAKDDGERLEAIVSQLDHRKIAAQRAETLGQVEQARTELGAAYDAVNGFWTEAGAQLTELLGRSWTVWNQLEAARARLNQQRLNAAHALPDEDGVEISRGIDRSLLPGAEQWEVMMANAGPFMLGQLEPAPWTPGPAVTLGAAEWEGNDARMPRRRFNPIAQFFVDRQ